MRLLLTSIGTAGDIHPFIAVGRAARAAGHDVVFLANPHFKARILDAGLGFWPLGTEEEYLKFVRNADLVAGPRSPTFVIDRLILPSFHPTVEAIRLAHGVFKTDLVFAHHISIGAPAACEALGIPFAQAVLAPLFWMSRRERVVLPMLPWANMPGWLAVLLRRAMRPLGRWVVDRPVNRMRREVGVPPLRDIGLNGPRGGDGLLARERLAADKATPTLGLWSPSFRAPLPDDPSAGVICGFSVWDRPPADEQELERTRELARWMDEGDGAGGGDPPVVVTLGSSVSHHGADVYRVAAEACALIGKRVVLLTGADPANAGVSAACARAVAYAPYGIIMPRACAVVHHAGIGTTAAAMRSGKPTVIIPFANDEFDNAERARRLGVSITLSRRTLSPQTLAEALTKATADQAMLDKATTLGKAMHAEDGAARAVAELERLVK